MTRLPLLSCLPGPAALALYVVGLWSQAEPPWAIAFFPLLLLGVIAGVWFVWTHRRRSGRARTVAVRIALATHIVFLIFGVPVLTLMTLWLLAGLSHH